MGRTSVVLLLAVPLIACEGGRPEARYSVRDSAGIRIVESAAPAWAEGEAWTVSGEPTLHIGVVDGDPEYQFSVVAGVYERNARIVVGDFRACEVRFYGLDGRYLGGFGRQGDGPGEFGLLGWVAPYRGDSILTWDQRGRRLSVFTADGTYVRAVAAPPIVPPEDDGGPDQMMYTAGGMTGPAGDGTVLGMPVTVFRGQPGERVDGESWVTRFSADGDSMQSLGPFEQEMEMFDFEAPVRLAAPYTRFTATTTRPGGIFVADQPTFEVKDISFDGGLQRIIRASHVDLTLTPAHRDAYRESERTRLGPSTDPGALETALADVRFPETIPPTVQILLDSEGYLWVRHYSTRWTPGPETWSVFDPDGVLLGLVHTPERLQVRQIGPDFLLGIWTDDLDVRYIRRYALSR